MYQVIIRTISGVILIGILLLALFSGKMAFYTAVFIVTILAAMEWQHMIDKNLSIIPWKPVGLVLLLVFAYSASFIYYKGGPETLLLVMLIAVVTDTGAFVFGKLLKGPKLSPRTSPNKTWSGFLGGLLCAGFLPVLWVIIGQEIPALFADIPTSSLIFASCAGSVVGQMGDLMESGIKRKAKVKDSGSLIPGHGGVLDRIDSLLTLLPFIALLIGLRV